MRGRLTEHNQFTQIYLLTNTAIDLSSSTAEPRLGLGKHRTKIAS